MKLKKLNAPALLAVLAIFSLNDVLAHGLRNPPDGAQALALGAGKMTLVQGPGALVHNPAALAGLEGPEVSASANFALLKIDFDAPGGRSGSNDDKFKMLPSLFGAYPLNENTVLGLGVFVPFGQSAEWDKNGPFRGVAPYFAELFTLDLNPTVAYRVNEKFSVAAGLNIIMSEIQSKQLLVDPANPAAPALNARAEGDGDALGWNLGASFVPADGHQLALAYRSGFEVDYDGDTAISPALPPFLARSGFSSEIEFPHIVSAGYGMEVAEGCRVGMDIEWIEFSSYDALPLNFGANGALLPFPPALVQDWDDVWTYGLGVEYDLNESWVLRGGWDYMEGPVPEMTLSPTLPDSDRHAFSAGVGYRSGPHTLDAGYAVSLHDADVDANLNPAYVGSYDMERHVLSISYSRKL